MIDMVDARLKQVFDAAAKQQRFYIAPRRLLIPLSHL
jgi:hypothetical protein